MTTTKTFRTFHISVRPSPETNDHEVLFVADDVDLIDHYWGDMMGMDPDEILADSRLLQGHDSLPNVTVGRCTCGVVGCGSVRARIRRLDHNVVWECIDPAYGNQSLTLIFPAKSYDAEVERAVHDHSWETRDRRAARLLREMIKPEVLLHHRLTFMWSSGRVRSGSFSVSLNLEPGPYQVLVHVPWEGESADEIACLFADLLGEPPDSWPNVVWYPQDVNLGPPTIAGPGWRRAS